MRTRGIFEFIMPSWIIEAGNRGCPTKKELIFGIFSAAQLFMRIHYAAPKFGMLY